MTIILLKPRRIKLDSETYQKLHRQVLDRDGWRCQVCGALQNLEVHHRQFRSRMGSDSKQNLITLCAQCHAKMHNSKSN
jgi:5-methylcytosine-specific restriction endonuclease McrA